MASNIEELFGELHSMINEAKNVPLSSEKCMIERGKALDIIENIRAKFPVELKRAQEITEMRQQYLEEAKREAEDLRQKAKAEVIRLLDRDALILEAKHIATETIREADETAEEVKRAANAYCEDTLARMEDAVANVYDEVQHSRSQFRHVLNDGLSNRDYDDMDEMD